MRTAVEAGMGGSTEQAEGPDFRAGIELASLAEGEPVAGRAGADAVVLVRAGDTVFAVSGTCTHYGAPLAGGVVTGTELRCPWHHACFSLTTGAALAAPALNPLDRYRTEVRDGRVYVLEREAGAPPAAVEVHETGVRSIVIVGAGAAGHAAVETLRGAGHSGAITVIDADADAPYDRPNLSKDYLAGNAPAEWLPLRPQSYYAEQEIDRIVASATHLDCDARTITLSTGRLVVYDALLLATGARPVRPPIEGSEQAHVYTLRSLADCHALIAAAARAPHVVIVGASFIGLEAAAALRMRGAAVTVVAPEPVPFARVLGAEIGTMLRDLHEQHGVQFRLGRTIARILETAVVLDDGSRLDAGAVLLATGVRPVVELAAQAGLAVDNGVLVDEFLETSVPGVYAAGDIAALPGMRGERVRIEHWVVAQRQGQAAARNMLGQRATFRDVPFFWTQHYDVPVAYVGHAAAWDRAAVDGSPSAHDCRVRYYAGDELLAVATINRDEESLRAELAFEDTPPAPSGAVSG
ncbi:MAG TPA: FAD-dependent oxidoreductase [Longimicrobiales bacterium]|nr:FAD-dependent oxidoreductase [Longimicrobiales bacterium]